MKLKCQLKGANCPPFKHNGIFHPDNETIKRFLPDLNKCANCMACASPPLPNFRDDFLQIASMTLVEKGTTFNPVHESGANFGTFIRPRICVSLMNARQKEFLHQGREGLTVLQRQILAADQMPRMIEMSDLFQIFLIRPLNFLWIDSSGTSRLLILSGLYRNS